MGQWHEGPAFDIRLGDIHYTKRDESEANVVAFIRPHGQGQDIEPQRLIAKYVYVSNNSPTFIKMKLGKDGKIVFGSYASKGPGWKRICASTLGYSDEDALFRMLGQLRFPYNSDEQRLDKDTFKVTVTQGEDHGVEYRGTYAGCLEFCEGKKQQATNARGNHIQMKEGRSWEVRPSYEAQEYYQLRISPDYGS